MTIRPAITTTIMMAVLVATAALPMTDVFSDQQWMISVLGAAAAAAVIASLIESAPTRVSIPTVAAATVVGAVAWALLVSMREVFWADPGASSTWADLGDGIFGGWGALLDEESPITDPLSAEIFAGFLTWVGAAIATHQAVRLRSAVGGMVAAAIVLWISTAAALPQGLAPAYLGAGAGAMALFVVATITRPRDETWRTRRVVSLVVVVGVASGIAAAAGALTGSLDRDPVDPRASRATEVVQLVVPDILAEFGVRTEEGLSVLRIDSTTPPPEVRLRLQVYDTHDGERWLPATGFEQVARFPEPEILPPGDLVSFTVILDEYDGPWLPLPDHLIETSLGDIQWNPETQTAIVDRPISSYQVTGTMVGRADLEGLDSAREEVDPALSEVPAGLPESIRAAATDATAGTTDAITAIDAITARLRELGRDDSTAPGNSFGRLRDDLVTGRATGAEQIASLHALMLRSVGIPSRLVVGYVSNDPLVESSDLHVWTEVAFPGLGWRPLDPVPSVSEPAAPADDEPTVTTTSLGDSTALEARALPREIGPGEDPEEAAIGSDDELTRAELVALIGLAVVAIALVLIAVRLVRRRLRHANGRHADVRVLGAWAEMVDRLRELGAPITSTTTIEDVVYMATAMDEELGTHADVIGAAAATSLHAPVGSSAEDAARAWEHLRRAELALRRVRGRRVVIRRLVDPRVLRYRAPRPPDSRYGGRRSRR